MLSSEQKALLHIYSAAARLPEATYRLVLREAAACASAADEAFTQAGFERAMAALEAMLFQRVADGRAPDPRGTSRWISAEFHWRQRLASGGVINSRQFWLINQLWAQLSEFLPAEQHSPQYLIGIVRRAVGRDVLSLYRLDAAQAGLVIDALKDRLAYAISAAGPAQPQEAIA